MTRQGATKLVAWVSLLVGIALFGGLVAHQGVGDVFSAVALAGWGLFAVTAAHLVVLLADAAGWRALLGSENQRSLPRIAWMWWIGNSVNDLLPVARIGGELVRARLLGRSGVPGALAGGSVVVSLTAGILTLLLFAGTGVVLLAAVKTNVDEVVLPVIIGLTTFGCILFGFYLAQRAGLFLRLARVFGRLARRDWSAFTGGAAALDSAVIGHYRDRRAFFLCCLWRLAAWFAGVVEVWLALHVLGHPVSFRELPDGEKTTLPARCFFSS